MLSAAAFAIAMAENSVPATAPATFQAGVYNGFTGLDVRAEIEACFTPDQKIADDTGALIEAIKTKSFGDIKSIVTADEPLAIKDAAPCMSDPKYVTVKNAYEAQQDLVKAAMADPDWQLHAIKDIKPNLAAIKAGAAAAVAAFDLGTSDGYFNAGVEIGKIDKIVFAYWMKKSNDEFLQ